MDKFFGLLMYAIMLPVLIIIGVVLANETKPKKNIILGVTMPYEARTDVQVAEICAAFRRRVRLWTIFAAIMGVPMLFLPWFSVQLTVFIVWTMIVIVVPNLFYIKANLALKALKKARGWFAPSGRTETWVDMGVAVREHKPLSQWLFVPPLIISLIPVVLALTTHKSEQTTAWVILGLSFAGTVLMSWLIYPIIFRLRTDVVGSDTSVNAALTNVRRVNWGRAWIYIAWTTALLGLFAWLLRDSGAWQLIIMCLYTLVLTGLCVWTELGVRRSQEELTAASGEYIDEDENWPLGMFYYNPNDRHLTVNDRVGMNMSVNMARPLGKILMGAVALLLVAMPFLGVWMMGIEFSPRRVEISGSEIVVTHLSEQFSLSPADIDSAELIEELPKRSRIVGTGMDTLSEGRYSIEGYGDCIICLDPTESPYIVLKTDTGIYIFNAETPEETRADFEKIRSETNA
ncbi:MAG: hypothetical protein RR314_01465 [Oscillospiraceae bacterium]